MIQAPRCWRYVNLLQCANRTGFREKTFQDFSGRHQSVRWSGAKQKYGYLFGQRHGSYGLAWSPASYRHILLEATQPRLDTTNYSSHSGRQAKKYRSTWLLVRLSQVKTPVCLACRTAERSIIPIKDSRSVIAEYNTPYTPLSLSNIAHSCAPRLQAQSMVTPQLEDETRCDRLQRAPRVSNNACEPC